MKLWKINSKRFYFIMYTVYCISANFIFFKNKIIEVFINNFVSLEIGDKHFSIPLEKLYMKREQIYRLKGQGISQILEKDIYNVSYKSDIIVNIKII